MAKVAVIMGSASDFITVEPAVKTLQAFGVEHSVHVMSAHRTPEAVESFSKAAVKNGYEVIIAAAGKAAHLGGVIAAYTTLPVIGLPIKSSTMDGLDSLLSMVQMPSGVPVATVAINGAENAAILAVEILGIKYPELAEKLREHKQKMSKDVLQSDNKLQEELLK